MIHALVLILAVLVVFEIIVKRTEVRDRKRKKELALLRIADTRMDMGGGARRH